MAKGIGMKKRPKYKIKPGAKLDTSQVLDLRGETPGAVAQQKKRLVKAKMKKGGHNNVQVGARQAYRLVKKGIGRIL
jgi:hypothetical protein